VIPLFKPSCSGLEVEMVTKTLRSGWWSQGAVTEKLEWQFARYTGIPYALTTSSGTSALEIAARALGLGTAAVIVPALTFVSTAQSMLHAGANVVYADVKPDTLTIDWDSVRDIRRKSTTFQRNWGVVSVWYGGHVDEIPDDIKARFTVIEDCAHAAGSENAGRQGDAAAWSFHAVKNLAAGDGGMITYHDDELTDTIKQLRWCGIDRSTFERDNAKGYGWDYDIPQDGLKAHMNDITASLALAQLYRLNYLNYRRWLKVNAYHELLDNPLLKLPGSSPFHSNHLFVVRVASGLRDKFIDHMRENGVSVGVHYKPLYYYKSLRAEYDYLPVTDRVWREIATLPLYPDLTGSEQDQVIEAANSFRG
jgi:dTDP-4-amino-4,6-dideoxygalactose transaminase